jgi:hypothetical protein
MYKGCAKAQPLYHEVIFEALCLRNRFVRAGAFAGAAVDAFVGVDYVGGFTLGDGAHRADIGASAAGDTDVGIDLSCHSQYSFIVVVCSIQSQI